MLSNWDTCGLDLGLAGETSEVTSLDLLGVIENGKAWSWEEQGGEEGTGSGELRAEEFLKLGNEKNALEMEEKSF